MKTLLLLSIFYALSVFSFAQDTPKQMTKIVAQLQGPEIPADSFAAKPKTMYRAGSRYCRVEEEPDTKNGIQGLLVVNEPDYWMANLISKTARHGVDPGPTFNCHMPMFADDPDKEAAGLEFGLEMEFSVSSCAGPLPPTVNRYFPAGTTAFCQWTSWVSVKLPAASWAEARLGAKFRALKVKTAA
jgi:hypothetical protein